MAARTPTRRPTRMTVNVTPVNDAPAGTDTHDRGLRGHRLRLPGVRLRVHRPDDNPPNDLRRGGDHDPPDRRHADAVGAPVSAGHVDPGRGPRRWPGIHPRRPTRTASPTRRSRSQVRDNGGTANGGEDTDQSPNTITVNVTAVNDAPVALGYERHLVGRSTVTFTAHRHRRRGPGPRIRRCHAIHGTLSTSGHVGLHPRRQLHRCGDLPTRPGLRRRRQLRAFTVNDGTTDSTSATVSLTVTGINDAPDGTDNTITTNEDTAHAFATGDFGFTDPLDDRPTMPWPRCSSPPCPVPAR